MPTESSWRHVSWPAESDERLDVYANNDKWSHEQGKQSPIDFLAQLGLHGPKTADLPFITPIIRPTLTLTCSLTCCASRNFCDFIAASSYVCASVKNWSIPAQTLWWSQSGIPHRLRMCMSVISVEKKSNEPIVILPSGEAASLAPHYFRQVSPRDSP